MARVFYSPRKLDLVSWRSTPAASPRSSAVMRWLSVAYLLSCGCQAALVRRSAPRQLPVTWSNPQGAVLTPIGDDIWLAERPFYPRWPGLQGTDVGCKAVVVRLPDQTLWVHAPVGLDGPLLEALAALGPVKHIVTPNSEHQKFAPAWLLAFPEAVGYACPGLREKQQGGGWERSLEELMDAPGGVTSGAPPAEWAGAIELCWFRDRIPLDPLQRPFFNEVVFCHTPSRTLIVSDLWWNYPGGRGDVEGGAADVPLSSRLWKVGMDRVYRPVYNRLMRPEGWRASYDAMMRWDFEAIAPAHGEPIGAGGKAVMASHLAEA